MREAPILVSPEARAGLRRVGLRGRARLPLIAPVRDPKGAVAKSEVRRRYNEAAEQAGRPVMTDTQFGIAFTGAFRDIKKRRKGPKGRQVWFYAGIRLRGVAGF